MPGLTMILSSCGRLWWTGDMLALARQVTQADPCLQIPPGKKLKGLQLQQECRAEHNKWSSSQRLTKHRVIPNVS